MTAWNEPTAVEILDLADKLHEAGAQLYRLMNAGQITPAQMTQAMVFTVLQSRCEQTNTEFVLPPESMVHWTSASGEPLPSGAMS